MASMFIQKQMIITLNIREYQGVPCLVSRSSAVPFYNRLIFGYCMQS